MTLRAYNELLNLDREKTETVQLIEGRPRIISVLKIVNETVTIGCDGFPSGKRDFNLKIIKNDENWLSNEECAGSLPLR